jgi:hypothetical protein
VRATLLPRLVLALLLNAPGNCGYSHIENRMQPSANPATAGPMISKTTVARALSRDLCCAILVAKLDVMDNKMTRQTSQDPKWHIFKRRRG